MSDVESQLRSYVERRRNGRSATAQAMALSEALNSLLNTFPGPADYYFGPVQFDEVVLPTLRGVHLSNCGPRRPLAQLASIAGDFVLHADCESLSAEQQRDGEVELSRILAVSAGDSMEFEIRYCIVKAVSKLLFMRSWRGRSERFDREIDPCLAAEAARRGVIQHALRMLEDSKRSPLARDMAALGFGADERDADDVETLFNAHRMVAGLLITRDFATAIEVGLWVTKRSRLVKVFLEHLGRYPHESNLPIIFHTLRFVGQLASVCPGVVVTMQAGGIDELLHKIRTGITDSVSQTEVDIWTSRLCGAGAAAGRAGPPICWDPHDGGAIRVMSGEGRQGEPAPVEVNDCETDAAAAGLLGPVFWPPTREELAALPVRELKARLREAGISCGGCTEKQELVELLIEGFGDLVPSPGQQAHPKADSSGNLNGSTGSSHSMGSSSDGPQGNMASTLQLGQIQHAQHHSGRQDAHGPAREKAAPAPKCCACCGATSGPGTKLKVCFGCRSVHFCGEACQRRAWPEHKAACRASQNHQQG
ncbi:hypothetical protein N2152v2_009996 [Parachlorella kessleri]